MAQVKKWTGESSFPLRLNTPVEVWFRDGTNSCAGTVGDWYGTGGNDSNWTHMGDNTDIVEYREVVSDG